MIFSFSSGLLIALLLHLDNLKRPVNRQLQ